MKLENSFLKYESRFWTKCLLKCAALSTYDVSQENHVGMLVMTNQPNFCSSTNAYCIKVSFHIL